VTIPKSLVTAAELADFLAVEPSWVRENADSLGVWRLGAGPRARLRFDLDDVRRRLTACPPGRESPEPEQRMVEPRGRRRTRPASGTGVELLPIRGRAA
jgi:hypothetical protein